MTSTLYTPSVAHDHLLGQWYVAMLEAGELEKTFLPTARTIGGFYAHWYRDAELHFHERDGRIALAWWVSPLMAGVTFGLWIAPQYRRTRWAYQCLTDAFDWILSRVEVIVVATRQAKLLDPLKSLGYTVLGEVPNLWVGKPVWVLHLTREAWHGRRREGQHAPGDARTPGGGHAGTPLREAVSGARTAAG